MIEKIRKIYLYSGIYGIVVLFPQLFMENRIGNDDPPAITHVEFFYGFYGLALTLQLLSIIISTDPYRYRPMMIPAILGKATFGITVVALFLLSKLHSAVFLFGMVDTCIMTLFLFSYAKTARNI